jgi:hypothetical protein
MSATDCAALPVQLDLFTALFGALLSRELAGELLDGVSADHIGRMVDEGRLRAVNIARDAAMPRQLRIWRWSLDTQRYPRLLGLIQKHGEPPLASLLPHGREYLWSVEVQRFLVCSAGHIGNLFADGTLTGRRDGSQRLIRIEHTSLLTFLRDREIN